jgi:hypothetical protein
VSLLEQIGRLSQRTPEQVAASRETMLEQLDRASRGQSVEVYEQEPPKQLVASRDIIRSTAYGTLVVACPKGMPPASWLVLTPEEQASLVEPPPPVPRGTMHAYGYGFSLEGVVMGGYTIEQTGRDR